MPTPTQHAPLPVLTPQRPRRGRGLRTALRAVGALVALAALLLGLPGVLLLGTEAVVRTGTPDANGGSLVDLLTRPDNGNLFLWALVVVGWAAWLCFAASVVVEIPAQLRGRIARRLPALGWSQRLAAGLVGAVLATLPATAGSALAAEPRSGPAVTALHNAATAASATPADAASAAPTAIAAKPGSSQKYYVVREARPAESLWSIAETHLGSGERWREIARLNEGRAMDAEGRIFDADRPIQPGWRLLLPNDAVDPSGTTSTSPSSSAPQHVTVRQGDTLSAIAERTLGNADDWPRLYAANRAAVGSDPDIIDPGLVLTVPSAVGPGGGGSGSGGPGTPTPAPPTTPPSASPTPAPTPTEKPTPAPTTASPAPTTAASAPASAPAPSESAPSTPAPSTPAPSAPTSTPAAAPAVGHPDLVRTAETAAGGTALLAAALVAALGLRRRRQQERRRAHRRIPMPPPPAALFEAQLRARQDALGLDLLDRSLRSLARTAAQEQKRLPAVVAVRVTRARTVELHLAAPAAPLVPFRAAHASTVWWCTPESPGLLDPEAAADVPAPYPALVGLGTAADGSTVLVDLEAVRLVQLTGERPEITAVLRTLAVELALSPLADHLRLHYVGEAPELAEALGGDRLRVHATLEEAVAAVESRDRAVRERLLADGAAHVRDARARGGTDDAWSPDIVLCGDAPAGEMPIVLGRLLDARPRTCLAVVTGAPAPGTAPRARWTLPTTGACTLPGSNVEVELQRLDDGEYAHWIELLRLAASTDEAPAPEWTAHGADDEDEYDDEEYAHYGAADEEDEEDDEEDDEDYPEAEIAEAAVGAEPAAPPAAPYPARPYPAPGAVPPAPGAVPPAPDAAPPAPVRNGRGAHRGRSEAPYGLGVTPARPEAASPFPPERGAEPPAAVDARVKKQEEEAVLAVLRAQPLPSHPETAEPARPSIRVLGPVELLGARGPVDLDRRSRLTEIAAFLALNPGSDQRSLDLLLHASGESDLRSLSAAVGRLRDWLGDGSDGDPYLPLDSSQGYTFSGEVACDWDDFRGLHRRGLRGGPGSDLALARALSLVRGAPFAETDPTGYAWAEPFRQDMVSAIVDTAHELAVRRLARADYRSAEAAVYRGLLVEPGAELLHRDLLTVYAAAGARDQLLKAVSRLNNLATRSGRGLERETADLLRELLDA